MYILVVWEEKLKEENMEEEDFDKSFIHFLHYPV